MSNSRHLSRHWIVFANQGSRRFCVHRPFHPQSTTALSRATPTGFGTASCFHARQFRLGSSFHGKEPNCTNESLAKEAGTVSEEGHDSSDAHAQDEGTIVIPGAQTGGRKLAIVFTCNVCETRSAKQFTERSYTHGVVIVRCPGCENLHLIADRLGYFGSEDFDLQSIVEQTGEQYKAFNDDNVFEMSLEDLVGTEKMEELLRQSKTTPDQ